MVSLAQATTTHPGGTRVSWVIEIIPHRETPAMDARAMETLALSLGYGEEVIAVELAHTARGRHLLVRASSEMAALHLRTQLQARLPQAELRLLAPPDDPLHLGAQEVLSVVELRAGGAPYEPLRQWTNLELQSKGSDPVLGVMGALDQLPAHMRVVSQLALVPIASSWARRYQRLAVEHPLANEQEQRRKAEHKAGTRVSTSWSAIIAAGALVLGITAWRRFHLERVIPPWFVQALVALMHGKAPQLSPAQSFQLAIVGVLVVVCYAALFILLRVLKRLIFGDTRLYDQRRIAEKLARSAYRGRLRIYLVETLAAPPARPLTYRAHASGTGRMTWGIRHWWNRWRITRERQQRHQAILRRVIGAYRAYHTAHAYFRARTLPEWRARWLLANEQAAPPHSLLRRLILHMMVKQLRWEGNVKRSRLFLSGLEVGLLWHVPGETLAEMAGVAVRQERSFLAPPAVTTGHGWKIGTSAHAGHLVPVYFPLELLPRHKVILGRTGRGKSTLHQHLALAQFSIGSSPIPGLCVMEPHGSLVEAVLSHVPASRRADVTLIDLASQSHPVGLNPLDMSEVEPAQLDLLVSEVLTTIKHIWKVAGSWGSRIENVTRYSLKALAEANVALVQEGRAEEQYTLLDVVPLLTVEHFRRQVLDRVADEPVKEWWRNYYQRLNAEQQDELRTPVVTKISAYASSAVVRRIIGQPRSTISFRQIVEQRGLLLINTASGVVGSDVSSLLGATIMSLFVLALARQLALPEQQRRHFLTLIDEFGNYPVNYAYMMTELRKAGLSLVLAAQSLVQLDLFDEGLRPQVVGNAEHLFVFTLAGEDAYLLRHELGEVVPQDVVNLPGYTCYTRWGAKEQPGALFSLRLDLPPAGDPTAAWQIGQQANARVGRPADEVDAQMAALYQHHRRAPSSGTVQQAHPTQPATKSSQQKRQAPSPRGQTKQSQQQPTRPTAKEQQAHAQQASQAAHGTHPAPSSGADGANTGDQGQAGGGSSVHQPTTPSAGAVQTGPTAPPLSAASSSPPTQKTDAVKDGAEKTEGTGNREEASPDDAPGGEPAMKKKRVRRKKSEVAEQTASAESPATTQTTAQSTSPTARQEDKSETDTTS